MGDLGEAIDAEVIDDDLMIPAASFEIDMGCVQRDVEELTAAIDEALTVYGEMLVEPGVIEAMGYADVRKCEREMSKVVRAADEFRRQLNRDYKAPLDAAKQRYDELMGPVIELHGLFKARRVALDDAAKQEKRRAIERLYEDMAAYIALPLEGQDEPLVPFERIFALHGEKWLNKSTAMEDVERELVEAVQRIADGEIRLDAAGLAHEAEAKAVFWKTLDYDAAVAHDAELARAEQRQAALAAERGEAGAAPALAAVAEVAPAPAERTPRVMLIDGATDDECRQIGAFCKSIGVTGVFKGERFYEAVKSSVGF